MFNLGPSALVPLVACTALAAVVGLSTGDEALPPGPPGSEQAEIASLVGSTDPGEADSTSAPEPATEPEPESESEPQSDPDPDPDPDPEPDPEPEPEPDREWDEPITIAFGGDIHFEAGLAEALADRPDTMLDPVAEMMASADLAVANLETAITERGRPSAKQFNFRAPPVAFDALRAAGIDVVSMANNHGLDYGGEGLDDSLAHAEAARFPVIGIGVDADAAYAPYSTEIKGRRIAVIGATQVLDSALISSWTATDDQPGLASAKEVDRLVAEVRDAEARHDVVVVFLHWGIEGRTCPAPRQQELADRLASAGADVIVGGHAHRVQGGGWKDGAVVHYGLGNFVFYTPSGPGTTSGVFTVGIEGDAVVSYEWVPAVLRAGVATPLTDDDADRAVAAWDELRSCTDLSP